MTEIIYPQENGESITVDLKTPWIAALLAWLLPGAGHYYQQRKGKAILFFICIMGTFLFGLGLGRGRVVYASMREGDFRWQYFLQVPVGAVAFPAMLQAMQVSGGNDPLFVLCERYPADYSDPDQRFRKITDENRDPNFRGKTLKDGFMAPPAPPISPTGNEPDVPSMWYFDYRHGYDIGTLFTVVAGLLNLLAIYDAFAGPAIVMPQAQED